LDGDSSHNDITNLVVLCKDCHSEAHTTHAFARNLTPLLLRKYNESWRDIVRVRVTPGGLEAEALEYRLQVLLEFYLLPHQWKNRYIDLSPGRFDDTRVQTTDAWAYLVEHASHRYSEEEWTRYRPLFDKAAPDTANRLEGLIATYGDAVGPRIKLQVFRTASSLRNERLAYLYLPKLVEEVPDHKHVFFERRFKDTLLSLMSLSHVADEERTSIRPNGGSDGDKNSI
jgi:hypothetical protein